MAEFGTPRSLPRSGGWIIEREIPNAGAWDGMGCYPLFACRDWAELRADLDDLASSLVSITVVTDPFGIDDPSNFAIASRISSSPSSNFSLRSDSCIGGGSLAPSPLLRCTGPLRCHGPRLRAIPQLGNDLERIVSYSRANPACRALMKSRVKDFAAFGGAPAFATTLHIGRPNLGRRDRLFDRLSDPLDRRWLTNDGPYVQELETALAN